MVGHLVRTLGALLAPTFLVAACAAGPAAPSSVPDAVVRAGDLAPIGATEEARVVRVVDGDTLIVDRGQGDERLRYIGIDAPESVKPETPVEFMGHEAAVANADLVESHTVVLERDVSERDRFGRLLRYVWLREGEAWRLVNLELVEEGYAQEVSFPPDVRRQDIVRAAEADARAAGAGLWGPTPAP